MRKTIKIAILSLLCTVAAMSVQAQGVNNVRINEILVNNENSSTDVFGVHAPWMELFNNGYERVTVSGCYVGVTYADGSEKRCVIPSDKNTTLGPLSFLVLYFDNPAEPNTSRTNFHTGLSLENATMVKLYQASGKDVIDSLVLPTNALADVSYGMAADQEGLVQLDYASMGSANEVLSLTPRHELFRQRDPKGGMMALVAMSVVFSALILIFLVLKILGKVMIARSNKGEEKVAVAVEPTAAAGNSKDAELAAAIATALCLYQSDSHDKESYVITFDPSFEHSPWSAKSSEMTEGSRIK
ncbi:MAG: OadG family protein [Tidjanibacter sp.]|nr:OadG family protein [Tidjanibacter sp.]